MSGPHETNTQPHVDEFDLADVPDASAEIVPRASLVMATGPSAGRVYGIAGRDTIIGRGSAAQVRIDEPGVSSKHAQITLTNAQHVLTDLGSTNGTFLNGRRLEAHQPTELAAGDSIQIAETVLSYVAANSGGMTIAEPTQQLSRLAPMMPDTSMLRLPEAQLLAQLLQGGTGSDVMRAPPTLDQQIARITDFLRVVKRHWALLFAVTALGALIADATVFISPPVAEAAFQLRILPPKPFGQGHTQYDLDLFYASTEQNFVSPGLITATLTTLNKKPPAREVVAAAIAGLKLESVGEALYRGVYSNRDPSIAVSFLKHHLEGFVSTEIRRSVHVAQAEVDFLSARLKETEKELARTEGELQDFKGKHLEGLPENATGHLASRESLITRRAELSAQVERTRLELDLARKQLREEAPLLVKRGEGSEQYEKLLVDLRRQLSEARAKGLGDQHPQIVALKKQIDDTERMATDARSKAASSFDREANPGLVALRNRVGELEVAFKSAQAEAGSVGGLVTRLDSIVGTMPEVEARYAELTRSYVATKDMHAKLFDKLRTNQLQLELERASAKARYEVVSPPETSGLPLRRALMLKTLIGLAAGIALGALLVAFLELRRYLKAQRTNRLAIVATRTQGVDTTL